MKAIFHIMLRLYIIAADSRNRLRPSFETVPSRSMKAAFEVLEDVETLTADQLFEYAKECMRIARVEDDQSREPDLEPEPPIERPRRNSDKRDGKISELGLGDRFLDNSIRPDEKAGFDERNPPPPDPDDYPF